jgi:Family of unknown function (DUF5317)
VLTTVIVGVAAALIGVLRGGSLDSLAETKFRAVWLLVLGLVVQLGFGLWSPAWLNETGELAVLLISNAVVALFVLTNRHLPGMLIAGIGLVLNLAVITSNGAMPVSARAAEAAGVTRSLEEAGLKHERLTDDTALRWLGDVIPIRPLKEVLSVGDLFLAIGIGMLVYSQTTVRREPGKETSETIEA